MLANCWMKCPFETTEPLSHTKPVRHYSYYKETRVVKMREKIEQTDTITTIVGSNEVEPPIAKPSNHDPSASTAVVVVPDPDPATVPDPDPASELEL